MAAEGKLRSLFVALDSLGHSSGVTFRPFTRVELAPHEYAEYAKSQIMGNTDAQGLIRCSRIEVGVSQDPGLATENSSGT